MNTPETTIENVISSPSLLGVLENESIEIFREATAAFRKPVMPYSDATAMEDVVKEVSELKLYERAARRIDGKKEDSMEKKKPEGCL